MTLLEFMLMKFGIHPEGLNAIILVFWYFGTTFRKETVKVQIYQL